MGLLSKLKSGDSTFGYSGEQPVPTSVAGENTPKKHFVGSQLDLNGTTPTKYADIAPEAQGGRAGA